MLNQIPSDITFTILKYLPVFDVHNLWQIDRALSHQKQNLKENYAKQQKYESYNKLKKFYKSIKIFSQVDVLDTTDTWCEAVITGHQLYRGTINLKIRYLGFSDRWNEWMRADNGRITEYGSKCYNKINGKPPQPNDHILYYHRNRWRQFRFVQFEAENEPEIPVKIVLQKSEITPPIRLDYIEDYLAPVSRRSILLS